MPKNGVNPKYGDRAAEERDVQERGEVLLRRELREHTRRGVDEERAYQGDVLKDGEHLMGNIDNAAPNNVIFIQFNHFMGPKCSKGATIKNFFIVQQEMGVGTAKKNRQA